MLHVLHPLLGAALRFILMNIVSFFTYEKCHENNFSLPLIQFRSVLFTATGVL